MKKIIGKVYSLYNYRNLILIAVCFFFILMLCLSRRNMRGSWGLPLQKLKENIPYAERPEAPRNVSVGEGRVQKFLEDYFQKTFVKVRPDFLSNPITHSNLELDCYNSELNLAVEYNGRQHYEYVPFFHASKEAYHNQRYRDELKKIWCKQAGITLITVPYTADGYLEKFL